MRGKCWIVEFRLPSLHRSFSFVKYGGESQAKMEAEDFHKEEAIRRGLVYNRYRIITTSDDDKYLEVQVKYNEELISFFCDIQDLDLVKNHRWTIRSREESSRLEVRALINGDRKLFHVFLGLYKITDHIDGNPLNNRRCNIRDGTLINARNVKKSKSNTSGVTGVSFNNSKNVWLATWEEGGKCRQRSFSIGKIRTYNEAFELAKQFRQDIDRRLNLNPQQYLQ